MQALDTRTRNQGKSVAEAVGVRFFSELHGKVELHRLAASYGIDRIELRVMERDSAAVSVVCADGGLTLFLNSSHPRVRLRFSVAHELAHWILAPIVGERTVHIRRFSKNQDPFGDQIEFLCDEMASAILMPALCVKKTLEASHLSSRCVPKIAYSFDTSFEAAARRFVKLSPERCALVVWNKSSDGSIRYSRRTIWNDRLGRCLIQLDGKRLSPELGRLAGFVDAPIETEETIVMMGRPGHRGLREVVHQLPVETFLRNDRGAPVYWSFIRFDRQPSKRRLGAHLPAGVVGEAQLRPQTVQAQLEFANLA